MFEIPAITYSQMIYENLGRTPLNDYKAVVVVVVAVVVGAIR